MGTGQVGPGHILGPYLWEPSRRSLPVLSSTTQPSECASSRAPVRQEAHRASRRGRSPVWLTWKGRRSLTFGRRSKLVFSAFKRGGLEGTPRAALVLGRALTCRRGALSGRLPRRRSARGPSGGRQTTT